MLDKFRQRSYQLEHLDIGDYSPEEYEGCIVELQRVNQWLGDVRALRRTLFREIEGQPSRDLWLLDIGAGSGELLRVAAQWTRQTGRHLHGIGLELNKRSAEAILEESQDFKEISAVRGDALHLPFADNQLDYVICSLFTHHFVEKQIVDILREMSRVARRKLFVIDLHRHPIAYYFYTTVGKLFLHNRLLREDGALSILKSFTPDELSGLAERAGLENVSVARHFPFRLVLSADARRSERPQDDSAAATNLAERAA
jgi:ubiquinone/menaquinone biosynthesis C-methylase UbiE